MFLRTSLEIHHKYFPKYSDIESLVNASNVNNINEGLENARSCSEYKQLIISLHKSVYYSFTNSLFFLLCLCDLAFKTIRFTNGKDKIELF